jgi:uncharacterized protein YdhG (YjbR/CyaY superfamily)
MQSKAKTVEKYFEEVPAERAEALKRLRQLCIKTLRGYEESMDYGMPSYKRNGIGRGVIQQSETLHLPLRSQDGSPQQI